MAYTTSNNRVMKVGKRPRYVIRKVYTVPAGSAGAAAATAQVSIPHPGRLVAIRTLSADTQAGTLVIKRDTTDGVQIFTDGDISSDVTLWTPVGTAALDEATGATAATDGFSGGFPVVSGVHLTYASANPVGHTVEMLFRLCSYAYVELVAQSGADGSGVVTQFLNMGGPGVLSAIQIDYQNTPATADLIIKADSTGGQALLTRTSSQTDVAPKLIGSVGADEALNASAATDGTECGQAFYQGLFFDVAQTDAFTSGNEKIAIEVWCDQ